MSNLVVKVRRVTIAACMTCPLCHKLFRDATTISECLHTFCRKCIYKKLQDEETDCCPICNIDLGCVPVEKLRCKAKIKRQKVKAPEIVPSVTLPVRRKERSLSSLVVSTPRVSTHSGMTGRRSKIARKSLRGSSFSIEKPIKNEEGSSEDQPESSCSPETLNKFTIGKEVEGSGVKAHPPSGSAKPPARGTRVRLHLNNPRSTEAWAGMDNNSNVLLLAKSIRNAFNPQMFSQLEPTDKWERHMMEKFRAITAATVIMEEEDELRREMVNLKNRVQELESKNAPLEAELKIAESSLSADLSDPCLVELDGVPKEIISLRRTIAGLQEENLKLKDQAGESSGARKQAWMDEPGFLPEVLARFSVDPSTVDQFLQSLGEVPAFNERLVDDRNRTHHRGMRDFQMHLYGYLDKIVKIPDYRDVWDLPAILDDPDLSPSLGSPSTPATDEDVYTPS